MSWLAVGGPVRTIHDVSAQRPGATAPSTEVDAACQFIGSPAGPARCDHRGDHRAVGRLHPSGTGEGATGAGYPADGSAAPAERHSPTARPPSSPSLAELQVWRR